MVERYIAIYISPSSVLSKLSIRYNTEVQRLTIDNKPCLCILLFPSALGERNAVSEGIFLDHRAE